MNLPVGTVPFYKEPYQGLGSDALSRVRKQFCHPGQEKKNPELNTTGNNDAAFNADKESKKKPPPICSCISRCDCKTERIGMNERRKLISDTHLKKNMHV